MTIKETLQRARMSIKLGDNEQAEKLLKQLIRIEPQTAPAYLLLGTIYEQTGRLDEARRQLLLALKIKSNYGEAYNNLGIISKNMGHSRQAVRYLHRALDLIDERADVHYNLGNVYKATRHYSKAIEHYQEAIKLNPLLVESYNNLGILYERLGKYDQAVRIYEEGLQRDHNNPKLRYNLGIIFKSRNMMQAARQEFEQALRSDNRWPEAKNNLGVVYYSLGQHEQAVNIFRDLINADPDNAQAFNNMGVSLSKLNREEEAITYYIKALQLDPVYATAAFNLAGLYESRGLLAEAVAEYEKLIRINPADINTRYRLAKNLLNLAQHDEAIRHFNIILEHDPENLSVLRDLGSTYFKIDDIDRATACFERIFQIDPRKTQFHIDLALIWKERGNYAKAVQEIKKHLTSHPDDYSSRLLLGELLYLEGRQKYAAQVFLDLTRLNPNNPEAYYFLTKIYRARGDLDQSIKSVERLITMQGTRANTEDLDQLGGSLELYESVIREYEKSYSAEWLRNLKRLAGDNDPTAEQDGDLEDLSVGLDQTVEIEEDSVPIIDIGGLEPVFSVQEQEESIELEEDEDKEAEQLIKIRHEPPTEHFPVTQLLPYSVSVPLQADIPDNPHLTAMTSESELTTALKESMVNQTYLLEQMRDRLFDLLKTLSNSRLKQRGEFAVQKEEAINQIDLATREEEDEMPEEIKREREFNRLVRENGKAAGLINHLLELTAYLPNDLKVDFIASDIKAKMESLAKQLADRRKC